MNITTPKLMLFLLMSTLLSCGDDPEPGTEANTWTLQMEGHSKGSYHTKTISLSTNTFQVVEAKSEDNNARGDWGISSTLTLYFATIGPPPSGTYKITSVDKLSGKPDHVAVYMPTFGDPATGLSGTYWYSQENSDQTISYTFKDGKISASFNNVTLSQGGTGPSTGVVSANISQ